MSTYPADARMFAQKGAPVNNDATKHAQQRGYALCIGGGLPRVCSWRPPQERAATPDCVFAEYGVPLAHLPPVRYAPSTATT